VSGGTRFVPSLIQITLLIKEANLPNQYFEITNWEATKIDHTNVSNNPF
jgi:hypothetical protein